MSNVVYQKLGKSLKELFFFEKEQSLLEARNELAKMQETKENLAKVSGIKDDAVLEKLIALEIRPETLATLFVVPMVEVAWADGELQSEERNTLFSLAEKAGLKNGSINQGMFSLWLKQKPDPALLAAWTHYIQALCERLSDAERRALKKDVMADARAIATAAGGFLGFGKLAKEEQAVLDQLEAAFN